MASGVGVVVLSCPLRVLAYAVRPLPSWAAPVRRLPACLAKMLAAICLLVLPPLGGVYCEPFFLLLRLAT